ncbi:DEAD/DEAH box helicase [Rhodanobacter denitrificans]|uniref:DEAD/DEAH box helicase n=1 Tax=Rhodanobacter denitrificans TaxID=666685 RepID=UPI00031EE4A5|nr:DEAD/DEAH box helicase [Rhodanobacter denitrificans]UJM90796.1 DEAD/DEAH box helicase [Rhodanobacter denitrificans]
MIPDRLHQLLHHAEWASTFDARTLQRAADYARRQRVIAIQFTSGDHTDSCALEGDIRGSARQPYHCRIDVQAHDARLTVDTRCSCPVGVDCKHAAAMLLLVANLPPSAWPGMATQPRPATPPRRPAMTLAQVQSEAAAIARHLPAHHPLRANPRWLRELAAATGAVEQPMQAWSQWLRQLDQSPGQTTTVDPQREFGVLLRGDGNGGLLINPVWMRPGKTRRAALIDPQPLQLSEYAGPVPTPAEGWPDGIAGALAVLLHRQHARVGSYYWTAIHAPHQEQALHTLLAHYPAYFEKGSAALSRGPDLPLHVRWQGRPDGSQHLTASVDGEEMPMLLRGVGLWYVLPKAQVWGRVDGATQLLDSIAHAPPVLPEQVDVLRQQLRQHKGAASIPLPEERAPVQHLNVAPQPVLQLRVIELSIQRSHAGPRTATALGCARLAFDYGGHLLVPDPDMYAPYPGAYVPPTRLMHDGHVLEIARAADVESFAEQQLENLGMVEAGLYAHEQGLRRQSLDENDFVLQPHERKPPLSPEDWKPALDLLADAGFRIDYDASFPHDELVDIDHWHADLEASGTQWFDVSLGVDVGGQRIDLLPVLRRLLVDPGFPRHQAKREKKNATWRVLLDEKRSANIPLSRLRTLIEPLLEWLEGDGELRLHRSQAPLLAALDEHLHWHGGELLRAHLDALQNLKRSAKAPRGFKATLRPYQRDGLAWLDFLGAAGLGGILADDMGLGKTVQVLAHILGEKQRGRLEQPALVVAPTSLVGNWQSEAARFAPALKVLVIHGIARADRYDEITSHDLIITTYPLLPRDREQLLAQRFALLVLDEAQAIKNAKSQAARVVREIPATRRLAMTGTPLENHLGELWAQFDAVEPGLLGSQHQFTRLYRTPIEKHGDVDRQQRLNRRIGPLLLRRRKDDVLTDLPPKTEIVLKLELEDDQRALYETLRLAQHERVRQAVAERGLAQSGIIVLDALLKLRQACCDPRLVKLASAQKVKTSAKLDALLELLDGLLADGRRVLLFSQFTEMLSLIEAALHKRGVAHQTLTGQTPARDRTAMVKRFQQGSVPLFLISLKAGGVGLNITAADTVIHYDPWWNPAVEAQATDRAHRIGQDKPVFVYRLICAGTVEEKIQAMQGRKAELARAVLESGGASTRLRFDEKDLEALFGGM